MNNELMSENINELMGALAKAQGQISAASKDSGNPYFNSKYADLNSVWNACRESLSVNGLAVIQTMAPDSKGDIFLNTILGHSSGQWIKSLLPVKIQLPKDGEINKEGKVKRANELQLLGSAITYLRRYALAAIVGVAPDEDDDANSGGQHYKSNQNNTYSNQQYQTAKPVMVEQPRELISKQQTDQLVEILKDCEDSYQSVVMNAIRSKPYNAKSISEIPVEHYSAIKNGIIKNRDSYIERLSKEGNYMEKVQ